MSVLGKLSRRSKKTAVGLASRTLVEEGYSKFAARLWVRELYRDMRLENGLTSGEKRAAHKTGYTSETFSLRPSVVPQAGAGDDAPRRISQREYLFLQPFNRRRFWTSNRVVANRSVPGLADHTPAYFCSARVTVDGMDVIRLAEFPSEVEANEEGLLELIRIYGAVRIIPLRWNRGNGRVLTWAEDEFRIDGWPATEEQVRGMITEMCRSKRCLFYEYRGHAVDTGRQLGFEDTRIRFYVGKHEGESTCRVLDAELLVGDTWRAQAPSDEEIAELRASRTVRRGWGRRRERQRFGEQRFAQTIDVDHVTGAFETERTPSEETADQAEQIPVEYPSAIPGYADVVAGLEQLFSGERVNFGFITVDVTLRPDGDFEVVDISTVPRYPRTRCFSAEADAFLLQLLEEKRADLERRAERAATESGQVARRVRRLRRRYRSFHLRSQGFTGRMARTWERRVDRDRASGTDRTREQRERAYAWGFMPATVARFRITEKKLDQFFSERDYAFVHPLNGKYGKWVRDRVSALTVFEPFTEKFENTHYHFLRRDADLQVLPLSEEAKQHESSVAGLAEFLTERGTLVLASSAWTGSVRLELSWADGFFTVDGIRYTADEFEKLLKRRVKEQFYVLVEPETADAELADLSAQQEVKLRVVMANPNGVSPRVAEAAVLVQDEVDPRLSAEKGEIVGRRTGAAGAAVDETEEAEAEAALAREEHRDDEGRHADEAEGDDERVEEEEEREPASPLAVTFHCRVDPETGEFSEARSIVEGQLYRFTEHPSSGREFSGAVSDWDELQAQLIELCQFAPQLEFVQFDVVRNANGELKIIGISALPAYGRHFPFSEETVAFLREKAEAKRELTRARRVQTGRWLHNLKLKVRKQWAAALFPEGLVPYQSVRWIGDIRRDLMERNGVPLKTKVWAYRNGFLSYRIPQYGITPENRENYISDFEYRWLRHINRKYKYWLEDKISIKYVAAEFNECLPGYYYYTNPKSDETHVVPMMDCPEGYEATLDDILRLAREKGVLALKPDEGSHGDGFYRLGYEDGAYSLNGEEAAESDVLQILSSPGNQYLITEFIEMHPILAEIYPFSVNTIRVIVFKRDGVTPQIGNAYLRIGSVKSGYVDNTAAGGMLAEIDVETGHFGNAQILERGRVQPCPRHPDTGVLIEGELPNWEFVKQQVLDIAADMPQLEYFGFDLAITPHGIKLPEINRFPDYPRIERLTPETTEYLLYKLEQKKRVYGYDRRPPRTPIKLPKRAGSR